MQDRSGKTREFGLLEQLQFSFVETSPSQKSPSNRQEPAEVPMKRRRKNLRWRQLELELAS